MFHFLSCRSDFFLMTEMKTLRLLSAAALLSCAGLSQAGMIHQYELNGSLADAKGGPALKMSAGGVLGADAFAFSGNQGLTLDYALTPQYTVDLSFRLDTVAGSYKRLLDFRAPASADHGLYLWTDKFCYYAGGCLGGGTMEANRDVRLTVTRDADKRVTFYQNGTEIYSFVDASGQALADGSRRMRFFIDDGGEWAKGSVDFIHLYDNALSAQEVRALATADVPEPASFGLVGAGLALLGWSRRRPRTA